jgi:hypothetical protein
MPARGQAAGRRERAPGLRSWFSSGPLTRAQAVVDSPQQRPGGGEPRGASLARSLRGHDPLHSSTLIAVVACFALAALSAAVLPTVPSYDPWSWIVWGREVSDPHLSFVVGGGPSWKPLPLIFTTVFGLFGGAAPTLWVITARAGGFLGLLFAWKLAARLTGGGRAGAFAGLLAVIGVVLTRDWLYYWFRGTSEPTLIGVSLWAIYSLLDRRHAQAFLLGVAASLIRPEWWPFIGLYGLWLWFKVPRLRLLVIAGWISIPVFWFVPAWIGSGDPFLAATHAAEYNGHLGGDPLRTVISRGIDLQVLPALIFAIVAVAIGWFKDRDKVILALGGGVAAWWVVVVGMTLDGYPGLERFFLPAAALTCVLGGVGITRLALLVGGLASAPRARAVAIVVAAALVLVSIPFTTSRWAAAWAAKPAAAQAVSTLDQLSAAVAAVGGHRGVFPCKSSFAAVNHGVQTALAWKLHVTLNRVGTAMSAPGVDFIGPHNATDGAPARVDPRLTKVRTLAQVGSWRVVRLTDPHVPALDPCVGR